MKPIHQTFALLPLVVAVGAASAADDNYTTLDTSVVSATGFSQDVREAPASVSVISHEELVTKPVTDIGSAIGDVPGVDIGLTKMGNTTISIRGFDSAYTLVMIDGKRQNTSTAMNNNGFDPSSAFMPPVGMIERIEVLRGPASVAWGSDAVGGVVNIITKRHANQFTGNVTFETKLQQHDDIYGNMGGTSFYVGLPIKEDTLSLTLRGRYQGTGHQAIETPAGAYASHTSTETYNANIGGRLNITVNPENYFYLDGDFTRFKGGSMQTAKQGYQARRWYHKYNAVAAHEGTYDWGTTETYFQFNGLDLMRAETARNPGTAANYEPLSYHGSISEPLMSSRTYTAATKFVSPFDFKDYGSMTLTGGLEISYETFEDNYYDSSVSGETFDQTMGSLFLEGEYFINDQWIATLGGRLNWSDIFGTNFAPRAYLVYKPVEVISFKGGVAAGYKTPNVKQLTSGFYQGTEVGERTYGNPDLKPEESWSYELSTTIDFGRYAQLTVGGFYTNFKNMLSTEELLDDAHTDGEGNHDTQVINYGKVRTRGMEVLLKTAKVYGFSLTGGYTLTDAEVREGTDKGERPNELPRHAVTARIDYEKGDFSAYLKSVSKFDMKVQAGSKSGPATSKYRDYTIVDLGASYKFMQNHRISVAINNLLDKDTNEWVTSSSGSWATAYCNYIEGRNLWLSYSYSF